MLNSQSKSFRTRLVIGAAATVVFVQLIGGFTDIYAGYKKLSSELDAKGALVVNQTSAAISQPLWDFDQPLVEEIVESLLDVSDVMKVTVRDTEDAVQFELLAENGISSGAQRIYKGPVVIEDGHTSEVLATLEVTISE